MQQGPLAPQALPCFLATSGLAATVSPSIAFPVYRLYDLPCSTDFSLGRGRFHQLLSMSLPSCRPYHPAEVTRRISQFATCHTAFIPDQEIRPSEHFFNEATSGFTPLRPDDSLTIPKMALSIGFIHFVSSVNAIQATGLLTFALVGLPSH